jgi:antitoxin component HigA of HigAB toxin-antitoxin module
MQHLAIKVAILERFPCQTEFAIALGDSDSKVSRVVRGRRKLSFQEAKKWSQVLKCSLKVLEPAIDKS